MPVSLEVEPTPAVFLFCFNLLIYFNWKLIAAAAKSLQLCPTLRPHRRQPTRLLCPWVSPGKSTGVGRHFLLQCMKVKSGNEVTQSCPTLRDPTDSSPTGSPVPGILQASTLEWVAISFSNGIKVKSESEVAQLCPTLSNPMDCM